MKLPYLHDQLVDIDAQAPNSFCETAISSIFQYLMHKHPTHRINDATCTSHISRRKAQPTMDIQEVKRAKKKEGEHQN